MVKPLLLTIVLLTSACVKDDARVSGSNIGTETGGATGGATSGSPTSGSDPLASYAWHLNNTGQTTFSSSSGVAGEDINVTSVHSGLGIKGNGVRIAVSDTGTDITHPDLDGNSLPDTDHRNYSYSSALLWHGSSPAPADLDMHGTGTAGLIAAEGWNALGSRGVAPSAKFASFRYVLNYSNAETAASYLAKSIDQTFGEFDIFNYSYGAAGYVFVEADDSYIAAIETGAQSLRDGKGAIYVQSAGNSYIDGYELGIVPVKVASNTNAHEELAIPEKIIVAATNASGVASSYSTPGSGVWVSAPGGEYGTNSPAMITTDLPGCSAGVSFRDFNYQTSFEFGFHELNLLCDYTSRFNGTSSAAPVVSGVVALMLEANPALTWRDVKHILAVTAKKIDSFDPLLNNLDHPWGYNLFGFVYDVKWVENAAGISFSNTYGFGRVDAAAAVAMARTYSASTLGIYRQTKNNSGTWYYASGDVTKPIPDEDPGGVPDSLWVGHNLIIESVQIKVTSDHPFPGDLAVRLTSPSGTTSQLLNLNNKMYATGFEEKLMLSNAFYGEESEGYWTIEIIDGDAGYGTGNLINWKILINGHRPGGELSRPLPPTFLAIGAIPATSDRTPYFSFSDSESAASVTQYEAAVGDSYDNTNVKTWTSVGLTTFNRQLTGLTLTPGNTYYLHLRARSSGGVSSSQVIPWVAN